MGPAYSTGIPYSFQGRTSPNAPSSTLPIFGGSDESFTRGSDFVGEERSGDDSGSLRFGEGVLFDPFLSTQVRRSDEASHQPQIPQFLGASTALQDGGDSYATRDCSAGRLVSQTGSEGCVLHSPDRSGTSKVPSFCGGPSPISIYVSPVRSVLRSLGIHQGSKTGCCSPKKFRSSPYCLYRRYACDRKIPSRNSGSRGGVDRSIRRSGVHNQQGEVRVDSISTDRVSGSSGGYCHHVPEPPRSQNQDDSGRSYSASSTEQYQCSKGSSVYRETECCSPGGVPSTSVLSTPPERPAGGPGQGQSELRILAPTLSGVSRGNSVVAGAPDSLEWSNLAETSSAVGDSVRCLPDRVGAVCRGVRTGGPWSPEEQKMHINCLELTAAMLAVQAFAKNRSGVSILLQLDNQTAVASINHLGGTVSLQLVKLAKALWLWALQQDIMLSAQHIPGVTNQVADAESRVTGGRLDWKLSPRVFQRINATWGPLEVDLFASRLSSQLDRFFSWRPDPMAEATDAFQQDWGPLRAYANPPWCLIGTVLKQVKAQQAQVTLVAPVWRGQSWYPVLLEMLWDYPRWIPPS